MESSFNTNRLFGEMLAHFLKYYKRRKKAKIVNVGGSRSGKTFDTAFLLMYLADRYKIIIKEDGNGTFSNVLSEEGSERLIIDVYRNELKKTRKTFDDFVTCISLMGIGDRVRVSSSNSDKPTITFPNGNVISFYGLPDDGKIMEASKSHIVYFNEALEIPSQRVISNICMRCEMMIIYDANPRETTHWLFDLGENDNDCLYTHTTYKDNKFLPQTLIDGIEELCPYDLSQYVLDEKTNTWHWTADENHRLPNEKNIKGKTANRRLWLIYGEGERCAREGAAFEQINWIADIPSDIQVDGVCYGLDFGFRVHESALVRCVVSGKSIYIKPLIYRSYDTPEKLYGALEPIMEEEEKWICGLSEFKKERPEITICCESQDNFEGKHFVGLLRSQSAWRGHENWDFGKVSKRPKYKQDLISNVNRFDFNVVDTPETKVEFLNYVFEEKNGEITSVLHGTRGRNDHDHIIDASLYAFWLMLRYYEMEKTEFDN